MALRDAHSRRHGGSHGGPQGAKSGRTERGAALIVSLMILAVITVLGTAAWQIGSQEERMVGHQRDRSIAFEAAEAALRDGERDLLCSTAGTGCSARLEGINGETGFGDAGVEGTCSSTGLCLPVRGQRPDFTSSVAIDALRATVAPRSVAYGTFTRVAGVAQTLKGPNGQPLTRQPRYVIEVMCYYGGGQGMTSSFTASCPNPIYRVTAMGWGQRRGAVGEPTDVVLQSFYSLGN
jgi:type IV pilus assembly protein PilX